MAKKGSSKSAATTNGDTASNGTVTVSKKKIPSSALQMSSAAESNAKNAEAPPSRVTDTSIFPSVSEDRIRQRAYELYMQRGAQHGRHADDWFRAERELRGQR